MPPYLVHLGTWEALWPIPVTALLVATLTYAAGAWKRREPESDSIFSVILSFSILGIVTGVIAGDSREPAVGATLPAVLSIIGGLAIYLVDRGILKRILVSLSVIALSANLIIGFFWGAVLRVNAEEFYYGIGRGGARGNTVGNLELVPIYVKDLTRALNFYKNSLEFKVDMDALSPQGQRWVTLSQEGQTVKFVLIQYPNNYTGPATRETGYVFGTDDLMRIYRSLVVHGVKFLQEPSDKDSAIKFLDPDGNVFTITKIQYPASAQNNEK
jgi:predicted enzyme related to lactoylglutathione lyase